jgi:hypothetical protein
MQLDKMNYEQSKAHWGGLASKFLVGKTIKLVRYMNDEELDSMGWDTANLVIFFTDGSHIFASMDDEGNDSGVLFTSDPNIECIPSIRNYDKPYEERA